MAAIAKQCFAFLLLAALFSGEIAARESQFFNKVPSNNADREIIAAAAPANQDPEPTFVPENENGGYGLYGHNAGQLPPATTTNTPSSVSRVSTPKYLPKNYNVEAYVTVPEGYRGARDNGNNRAAATTAEFDNNKNPSFYKSEPEQNFGEANLYSNGNYFNDKKIHNSENENENEKDEFNTKFYDSEKEANFYNNNEEENPNAFSGQKTANYELDNYKYNNGGSERAEEFNSKKNFNLYDNGNSYYNGQKQNSYNGGLEEAKFGDSSKYSSFESNNNGVQKQGMSDTRFLENGKYFYDVNLENQKYNRNYNRPANKNNAYHYNNYYQGQDLP